MLLTLALAVPWQAAERGYPALAAALAPLLGWLCWELRRLPHEGAHLSWARGEWQLTERGHQQRVQAGQGAVALPWVVLLPLRVVDSGARRYIWVFADSVPRTEWRRLRVRIRLPDPGRAGRP